MASGISRFKPGGKRQTHLFLSASLWSAVGCMLLIKGTIRLDEPTGLHLLLVVSAFMAGFLKSSLILDGAATRTIERILLFKDGTCLGAVYSFKTWGLVICMIGMGVFLRNSSLPSMLLAFVYITIGWALLFSSRLPWHVWLKHRRRDG